MLAETLEFEADTHTYRLAGRVLPSVTHVLRFLDNFEQIPRHVLEAAAQFGRHVHEACHLHNLGVLDWDALDTALVPYVRAYDKFLADTGFVVTASEERVVNATYGYAGTLDLRGRYRKRPAVVDIKSTAVLPASVGPQTAGYERCIRPRHGAHRRYGLLLRADHTYKLTPLTKSTDWSMLVTCLNLHNWKHHYAS